MTASVLLVGGVLAHCLLALRLRALRPDVSLTLIEGADRLGGNHTWSFHGTDVSPAILAWLRPLARYSWPHYDVKFPGRERRLPGSYHSLTAEHLHEVVMAEMGACVRLNAPAAEVAPDRVTLAGGEQLQIGALSIEVIAVAHDAQEPTQYVFSDGERRFGVLTDLDYTLL